MAQPQYTVQKNDNLWNIAKSQLGAGSQWPRIWRYNNRKDIVKLTGRAIANPDLIYPGQLLIIPKLPNQTVAGRELAALAPQPDPPKPAQGGRAQPERAVPTAVPSGLNAQLPSIQSPVSIKYRLDDLRFPPIETIQARIEMRIGGDIVMMTQKSYPALYVTQKRELESQIVNQANHAYGSLVSDSRVIYDSEKNTVTVRNMLVSQSNVPDTVATAVGIQMDSQSPIPKLRFEIRMPKLQGSINGFKYVALDVKFIIEVTPKLQPPSGPRAQPVRVGQPEPATRWDKVLGTGLIVVGTAIVVGTLVEDFFTAGAGVADDPVSFAAAGTAFARGVSMWRTAAVVLPAATQQAMLRLSFSMSPAMIGAGRLAASH